MTACFCSDERRHFFVHEAAHAVAALDHRIPFTYVEVLNEPVPHEFLRGKEKNGGLCIDEAAVYDLRDIDPVGVVTALFSVAVAGEAAETAILGHAIPGGAVGDFWAWVGWLPKDGNRPENLDEAKARFPDVLDAVPGWLTARLNGIAATASALEARSRLTAAEVAAVLRPFA